MDDLEHSEAKFKWMIVDACRNDPTRSATSGTRSLGNISTVPSGIVVLQSCASGQQSWEDGQFQHGVFTHFLIEGLKGQAANRSGVVSLLGLCQYAMDETFSHVQRRWNDEQRPYMKGELADFVLRSDLNRVEGEKFYREARATNLENIS